MSRTLLSFAFALAPIALAACASSEAAPSSAPAKAQPASTAGDDQSLCVEGFTRNRTCTAEYIPALVDSRAKLDKPAGIAEQVKADRDGVIAKANAEWAEDSKDENIARNCQQITAHLTDDQRGEMQELKSCLAQADCAGYVACITPFQEKMLAAGPH